MTSCSETVRKQVVIGNGGGLFPPLTGNTSTGERPSRGPPAYYMHQHVSNACGTFALCHALVNLPPRCFSSSPILDFKESTKALDPEERGWVLSLAQEEVSTGGRWGREEKLAVPLLSADDPTRTVVQSEDPTTVQNEARKGADHGEGAQHNDSHRGREAAVRIFRAHERVATNNQLNQTATPALGEKVGTGTGR